MVKRFGGNQGGAPVPEAAPDTPAPEPTSYNDPATARAFLKERIAKLQEQLADLEKAEQASKEASPSDTGTETGTSDKAKPKPEPDKTT